MSADASTATDNCVSLGEVGTFSRGRGGTKADASLNGVPCVRYGDLYTHHDSVIREFASFIAPESVARYTELKRGDVVFAASGETHDEIGKAAVYCGSEPAYAGADTIIFRPKDGVDARFLGYAVNAENAARFKARYGQGSSVIHISAAHLQRLPIFLPPIAEQHRIAEILDTLDEAILKAEEIIAKLQQMKQGLLHDLLTRGIDDNGELRDPERQPEKFQDSPLGRVPVEWEVGPAASWCSTITVGVVNSATHAYVRDGVPFVRSQNVRANRIETDELMFVTDWFNRQQSKSILRTGDLLLVRTGYPGTAAVVPLELDGGNCFSLILARPKHDIMDSHFMAEFINSPGAKSEIARMHFGSAQHNFNIGEMRQLPTPCPPLSEQVAVRAILQSQEQRQQEERAQLDKLHALKRGLMDDLLAGRVRVTPAEESAA